MYNNVNFLVKFYYIFYKAPTRVYAKNLYTVCQVTEPIMWFWCFNNIYKAE